MHMQVGIPLHVAKVLTFPEVVNQANLERMREHVLRGSKKHPGANYVELKVVVFFVRRRRSKHLNAER